MTRTKLGQALIQASNEILEGYTMSDGHKFRHFYFNRSLCSVLEDMRACQKTRNYAPLDGLIEEVQVLGNRMEAGLGDKKDLIELNKELSEARKAYKKLEQDYHNLKQKVKAQQAKLKSSK